MDAVDRGTPCKEVARIFGISLPSIECWLERRRETGDVGPSPIPGPPASNLPGYSPDLNPIEEAFSKIKTIVRKAAARTRGALDEAMGEALSAITLKDVAGWFSHCGYEAVDQYS